uniref:RNA helicase n=1 Tax=Oncorhynchus mykiss TaxID=8022 RepID=A0A8C7SP43_ONCMY
MSSLVETFVSKASTLQRQDRAGHVRNGNNLIVNVPSNRFLAFMDFSIPEILRVHWRICDFISALDAPQPQTVSNAVCLFQGIGACILEGHMLIFGTILGCLEPIATIEAAISEKSPFATPMNQKDQANLAKAALAIIRRWKNIRSERYRAETTYCRKHFLNRYIKQELIRMMDQVAFSSSSKPQAPLTPLGKAQICVLNAVVTGGLCGSVGRILYTPSGKAHIHPSSFNRCLLFQEKVSWIEITLSLSLSLGDIDVQHCERLISLVEWIHFQAPVRIGVIFKHLRKLLDSRLEKMPENPRTNVENEKTIQLIKELIKDVERLLTPVTSHWRPQLWRCP